jgi:phosphopantothenoylcysteine synthetase/decarboxylase
VHSTSNGFLFIHKTDAEAHAHELKNRKIETHLRELEVGSEESGEGEESGELEVWSLENGEESEELGEESLEEESKELEVESLESAEPELEKAVEKEVTPSKSKKK